jgi:hypothetical protein
MPMKRTACYEKRPDERMSMEKDPKSVMVSQSTYNLLVEGSEEKELGRRWIG